jgi:hypothetical protein
LANDQLEFRQETREEIARVKAAERDAEKSQLALDHELKIAEIKQNAVETIPIIDSKIGINLRHGFVLGEPAIDIEAMQERLELQKAMYAKQLEGYREDLQEWFNLKMAYEKNARDLAVTRFKNFAEPTCQSVPKNIPAFPIAPPIRPKNTLAMDQIPLVMSVTMVSEVRDSFIENTVPRRIPKKLPCPPTDKGLSCDTAAPRVPCE